MSGENELISVNATTAVNPEVELIKVENDTIASLARMKPRDHRAVLKDLLDQIEAYPSFAESVCYAKPIGKDKSGRMQFARGLSIRAAEAIASAWGYNRVELRVNVLDEDRAEVTAKFIDLQTGRIWADTSIVSKFYSKAGGGVARHSDDRFWGIVVNAEKSKRIREAIIRSVPPGVRSELQTMAERQVAKLLTNETVQKIVDSFAAMGVGLAQLENLLAKPIDRGWTIEDRTVLMQVYTAIRDGETTVAEAFGNRDRVVEKISGGLADAVQAEANK